MSCPVSHASLARSSAQKLGFGTADMESSWAGRLGETQLPRWDTCPGTLLVEMLIYHSGCSCHGLTRPLWSGTVQSRGNTMPMAG